MTRKYLAFDIETAKILPAAAGDLLAHRPLGIACAATLADREQPRLWMGKDAGGTPSQQMNQNELAQLVRFLTESVQNGFTILTWNGLGFDFDVLAEESGLVEDCRLLATSHVDMMFHVFCEKGYPVGLDSATKGMHVSGKSASVAAHAAPQLWKDGRHAEVLEYVSQDVRCVLELAQACEAQRSFRWITRKGTPSEMPLRSGWLTVEAALRLPLPDTSWMSTPLPRGRFTNWLGL
jgi:hypothetical protein